MNLDFSTRESVTVRNPATANLMIDSNDRDETIFPTPWDFQITKRQSIMNGYFTRIGTSEVVLEWFESNIGAGNNTIVFDISGTGANPYNSSDTIVLNEDNYTVARALDAIVQQLNDLSGTTGCVFSINNNLIPPRIECAGGVFVIQDGVLQGQLDIISGPSKAIDAGILNPDLRPYRYIDFVSEDLTYNQNLKDNSTAIHERNVLCRWYFSNDEQPVLDKYGFTILMGYTQFCFRRLYNPPKQIRWSADQPIGNLRFSVYDDLGELITEFTGTSNWLMTLQLSEN